MKLKLKLNLDLAVLYLAHTIFLKNDEQSDRVSMDVLRKENPRHKGSSYLLNFTEELHLDCMR